MKLIYAMIVVLLVAVVAEAGELIIDDFSQGKPVNSIGGKTGCWNINPSERMRWLL